MVTDDKIPGAITCATAAVTLAPTASLPGTCTGTYAIQTADLNASGTGSVTNHATAAAKSPSSATVTSNQAQATVRQAAQQTARIAPTSTTCADFVSGQAADLDSIGYKVKSNKINNAAPGVLFYYSAIDAPAASFTITVSQSNTAGWMAMPVQGTNQIVLYNANCTKSAAQRTTTFRSSDGLSTIQVAGATPGASYVIGIKYSPSDLTGQQVSSPPPTVVYAFTTAVNGGAIATSTDTISAVQK